MGLGYGEERWGDGGDAEEGHVRGKSVFFEKRFFNFFVWWVGFCLVVVAQVFVCYSLLGLLVVGGLGVNGTLRAVFLLFIGGLSVVDHGRPRGSWRLDAH